MCIRASYFYTVKVGVKVNISVSRLSGSSFNCALILFLFLFSGSFSIGLPPRYPWSPEPFRVLCQLQQLCSDSRGHRRIRTIQRWAIFCPFYFCVHLFLTIEFQQLTRVLSGFFSFLHDVIFAPALRVHKLLLSACVSSAPLLVVNLCEK